MVAALAVAAVLVVAIAILVGIRIGQSVQTDAASLATTASPAPSQSSTPTVENTPAQSPAARSREKELEPDTSQAVRETSVPSYFEPVATPPLPEQSFVEVQPLPPVAEVPEELPADPPSPSPEPTCPADNGVTLRITKAEPVYVGGNADEFKLTLELTNSIGVPVGLSPIDLLSVTAVRATGEEMWAGNIHVLGRDILFG